MMELIFDPPVRAVLDEGQRRALRTRFRRMVRAAELTEGIGELEVSVRLTDDQTIRELNRVYRDKDRPTDVLAFSQREGEGGGLFPALLGDVVISVDTARRQARGAVEDEILMLGAHGLCHLLGYDHQTDAEEADMNARVRRLLEETGRRGRIRAA